jgi:hypothetical protein
MSVIYKSLQLGAILAILGVCPALAMDDQYALGLKAATTGIGVTGQYQATPRIILRLDGDKLGLGYDLTSDGIAYEGDIDLQSLTAAIDLHPFANSFYLSLGVSSGKREVALKARTTGLTLIGNNIYTSAEIGTLTGKVELSPTTTYVGFGYDNSFYSQGPWTFAVFGGALLGGTPKTSLTSNGTFSALSLYQTNLELERQKLVDEADNYKIYPVMGLSLGYRF